MRSAHDLLIDRAAQNQLQPQSSDKGNLIQIIINPRYPNNARLVYDTGTVFDVATAALSKMVNIFGPQVLDKRMYVS